MPSQFQQSIYRVSGAGVPGEAYNDSPSRVQPFSLNSTDPTKNTFGTAFTVQSEGIAQSGNVAGNKVYAGILVNPKGSALYGQVVNATLTLPNGAVAELATMGSWWVTLPAAAAIGDVVIYDNTTGALSTIAPGVALPTGKSPAFANVDFFTVSGAGLAVITMTTLPGVPVPAGFAGIYTDPAGNPYTDPAGDDYTPPPAAGNRFIKPKSKAELKAIADAKAKADAEGKTDGEGQPNSEGDK